MIFIKRAIFLFLILVYPTAAIAFGLPAFLDFSTQYIDKLSQVSSNLSDSSILGIDPIEESPDNQLSDEAIEQIYLPVMVNGNPGPSSNGSFLETFDGDPVSPLPFSSERWDISVHTRNLWTAYSLVPMDAAHGPNCSGPPDTHPIDSYEEAVFQCRNHVMTAIDDDDYAVISLTPNHMVDFSNGEAVINFDMSTLRTSGRDWISIWVTPYEYNVHHPIHSAPDLQGHPKESVLVEMQIGGNTFLPTFVRNFDIENHQYETPGVDPSVGYDDFLAPDAKRRDTFELRISKSHIKFGMPDYNFYWVDIPIDPQLKWDQGIVQLVHHSYIPEKHCDSDGTCGPNSWHWDNISINPAIPFTILPSNRRYVEEGNNVVGFDKPSPPNSHLRFSAIGEQFELSFDGGQTWQDAIRQFQEDNLDDHFASFWTSIPAGVQTVHFRGVDWWGGRWHARDISIWSQN